MTSPATTVLVVEDEEAFVDALTVGLAREGFRVQVARDGAQALDLFDVVRSGAVKIRVNQTFPLRDAADAHRALEARQTTGSTVLLP